ncbi:hypothetical protein [Actinomycetospora chibensis]|uniref:Uncharacterized protein n=1 Tax=Actinomycetospora chibensis TaxID=663606 RepID=A0ABV9RFF7_9PSEU|nr:hypothetical protein [Actinomycetospora chibensis]MDD7925110.1 hypothetical protein [Actinomycetospora chibensis]
MDRERGGEIDVGPRGCPACAAWSLRQERATPETDVVVETDDGREALLRALGVMDEERGRLDRLEAELISAARRFGTSWREIAAALGLSTPQAAFQRASRHRQRGDHESSGAPDPDVA